MSANYSMSPVAGTVPATRNPVYAISIVGGLVAVVSAFLTWYSMTSSVGDASNNALGQVTGSLAGYTAGGSSTVGIGVIVIGAVLALIGVAGFMTNRRAFAIINLILSLLIGGFGALVLITMISQAKDDTAANASINAVYSVGLGAYLAVAGFAIVFVGSIVAMLVRRRS